MRPIFIREVNSFFSSIIGYVAVGVFLIACWLFLWVLPDNNFLDYGYASLDKFFDMAPWLLMLLIPSIPASIPTWAVVTGLTVSIGVGLIFGVWPARKASKLDPIECLRYE